MARTVLDIECTNPLRLSIWIRGQLMVLQKKKKTPTPELIHMARPMKDRLGGTKHMR